MWFASRSSVSVSLSLLIAAFVALPGCSDSPLYTRSSSQVRVLQRPARGKIADVTSLADSTEVTRDLGGSLNVGDSEIGLSSLSVPPEAVEEATKVKLVKIKVNKLGDVSAELGPDGFRFVRPVTFLLSYKGADLTDVDEATLRIYHYNTEAGVWELVPGSVPDTTRKIVSAPLWHFSRYVIGSNG